MANTQGTDEVGNRHHMLTVIAPAGSTPRGAKQWLCQCDCGSEPKVIAGFNLRMGAVKSCGCLRRAAGERSKTHGMTLHPAYTSYRAAKTRCSNPADIEWHNYGGRGVEFLLPPFEMFWVAMGDTWFPGATLDRRENAGHYELNNVRWATRKEQMNNTRNNVWLTFQGQTLNVSQWAERQGIKVGALRRRLCAGWDVERALTQPTSKETLT